MAEHNHLTRDIKPLWSGCHGCDEYHVNALQMRIAALLAERDAARAEVAAAGGSGPRMGRRQRGGPAMTARAVVERMMVGCEAASGNPWWCRVHESRIRFHVNPPTGGANDCDNFRDALDLAEEVQEKVLADLRAKVRLIPAHAVRMENKWVNGQGWVPTTETIDTVPLAAVLALIEEANRGR